MGCHWHALWFPAPDPQSVFYCLLWQLTPVWDPMEGGLHKEYSALWSPKVLSWVFKYNKILSNSFKKWLVNKL
jgi:hypothetical protein